MVKQSAKLNNLFRSYSKLSRKNTNPKSNSELKVYRDHLYSIADLVLSGSPFYKHKDTLSDPKSEYNIFMKGMKFGMEHGGKEIYIHNYNHDVLFFIGSEMTIIERLEKAIDLEKVKFIMTR
jgi:hypothetical protein